MSGSYPSSLQDASNARTNNLDPSSPPNNTSDLANVPPTNAGRLHKPAETQSMEELKPASRRRRPSANEHVKHRRTRNGCYTCRARRVKVMDSSRSRRSPILLTLCIAKCDEIRPVCERWSHLPFSGTQRFNNAKLPAGCRKGSRECTYPESRSTPQPSSGSQRDQAPTAVDDSRSSSDANVSSEESTPIERRRKKSQFQKSGSSRLKTSQAKQISSNSQTRSSVEQPQESVEHVKHESSLSPSTETSSAPASGGWYEKLEKSSSVSTDISQEDRAWSHLSQDLQFYLEYHKTRLNYHHYFFKHDANHFLHSILVEHALQYDPLLYAVVGFAAFQLTVTRPDGKIQDFLGYYNRSVSLLRKSLVDNQKHTDATMLTILQLATFEVRWNSCLPSRADSVQRTIWATGSAYLAIRRLPLGCFWSYTRLTQLWRRRSAGKF